MKIEVTGLFFFISSSHFVSLYSTRKKEKKVQKVACHITSKFIIVSEEYILGGILLEYFEAEFLKILRILINKIGGIIKDVYDIIVPQGVVSVG